MTHRTLMVASRPFLVLTRAVFAAAIVCASLCAAVRCASAEADRVALVFGNSRYANLASLPNAGSDARMMAQALRDIGFTVIEGYDLSREAMETKIRDFLRTAETAPVRLFYYAGHGVQVDGRNYLVPVSARLDGAGGLNFETVALDSLLGALDSSSHANVVILDACRNNPFARTLARTQTGPGGRAVAAAPSGLAGYTNVGAGTLVAFSTAPDKVALDGTGANSPFTAALARHVRTRGLEVRQMLTRVRADVAAQTGGAQIPWDNSALLGDVYLAGTGDGAPPPPPPLAADDITWGAIRESKVAAIFDEFIDRFPTSPHVAEARARGDELRKGAAAVPPRWPGTAVLMPPPAPGKPPPDDPFSRSVKPPTATFDYSFDAWRAMISYDPAVTSISWRTDTSGDYQESGFNYSVDSAGNRKRDPKRILELDQNQQATTVWVRLVDGLGATQGPFPFRFDPAVETRRLHHLRLDTSQWLFMFANPTLHNELRVSYSDLVLGRCAIRQARIGVDVAVPDRPLQLPPCDPNHPSSTPKGAKDDLLLPVTTTMLSAQVTYLDGTVSEVRTFRPKLHHDQQ